MFLPVLTTGVTPQSLMPPSELGVRGTGQRRPPLTKRKPTEGEQPRLQDWKGFWVPNWPIIPHQNMLTEFSSRSFPGSMVKNPPAYGRDTGSTPHLEDTLREWNGNPTPVFAWETHGWRSLVWVTVHGVTNARHDLAIKQRFSSR